MLHMRDLGQGAERARRQGDRLSLETRLLSVQADVLKRIKVLPRSKRDGSRKALAARVMMSKASAAIDLMSETRTTDVGQDLPVVAAFLLGCAYAIAENAAKHSGDTRRRSSGVVNRLAAVEEEILRVLDDPKQAKLPATTLAMRLGPRLGKSALTLERMIRAIRKRKALGQI
jgi:hypothetical protein